MGSDRRDMDSANNLFSYLRIPIAATSALAASLSGLLYWKQNDLIYPRSVPADARTVVPTPDDFPYYQMTNWETLQIPTPDGESLHGYLIKPSNATQRALFTVLSFHGNAGNIGHRVPIAGVLDKHVGVNVVMVEYRGYGKSTGTPDEKGLNLDATAGLEYVRNRHDLRDSGVIVYGQSIGGAVAVQLVAREQHKGDIKGLILENTFLSMRKLIPSIMPSIRFIASLCHQIWPTDETIAQINVPTLFLSGLKDEIVPASHMERLYYLSTAEPKILQTFADGTHNDTVAAPGYFDAMAAFLESLDRRRYRRF